jgi:hypothetical protein
MADVCDLTDGFNEITIECSRWQLKAIPKLRDSNGACLNSEAPIDRAQHFCSIECRDDFECIEAAKRRNGKP